jgi:hypothetical protein
MRDPRTEGQKHGHSQGNRHDHELQEEDRSKHQGRGKVLQGRRRKLRGKLRGEGLNTQRQFMRGQKKEDISKGENTEQGRPG